MLDAYVAASNGHIVLEVIDPRPFSEDEDRAVAYGIQSFQGTGGEQLFFGLAATNSTTGRSTINVFAPDREAFLEYDLTRLVAQLGNRGKPVVALIDGIGLAGSPMTRIPEQQTLAQMRQFFDVKNVPQSGGKIPDDAKVLMVVHPQHLDDATRYEIDQWVLAGKPTIVFVDPFAENQMGPGGQPMPDASSTLEPLFKAWGVTFDPTKVVGDSTYALQTQRNVGGRAGGDAEPALAGAARRRAGQGRGDPGAALRDRDDRCRVPSAPPRTASRCGRCCRHPTTPC